MHFSVEHPGVCSDIIYFALRARLVWKPILSIPFSANPGQLPILHHQRRDPEEKRESVELTPGRRHIGIEIQMIDRHPFTKRSYGTVKLINQ